MSDQGLPPTDDQPIPPPKDWKTQLRALIEKVNSGLAKAQQTSFGQKLLGNVKAVNLQTLEPAAVAEMLGKSLQKGGTAFYGKALTIVLCSYFLSDLTGLLAGRLIPEPPASHAFGNRAFGGPQHRLRQVEDYNVIFSRNLFNSQGIIPGEENPANPTGPDLGGPPVRTNLPFNLIGTLILQDELRSIATIEDKSASMVYPVQVDDEIPSKARIVKIEPKRVIFINTASGRREFVDLPEDNPTAPKLSLGTRPSGPAIDRVSNTQFNVSRNEVDKALGDLNNILTQARAVPNFENGQPSGYKLFQIVPGSIYDKLGLQNGDVIAGLNGTPINDPGKAFEMLNELKSGAGHLELQVKRDGRPSTFTYDIH
ncbi:MAG: type II secretion system protein GspC [Bdellovibrionota bacterium]